MAYSDPPTDYGPAVRNLAARQRVFGRYILQRKLGEGGFGAVWLAEDTALGEEIAIKFVLQTVAASPEAIDSLKSEAARSRKLSHPHIVRIHDFVSDAHDGECSELAGISMEYVEGESLAQLRLRQPGRCFDVEQIAPWIDQLCQVLDYAHAPKRRIIHRDLKPANLLLSRDGELKVADFGIACSLINSMSQISGRLSSGTPPYMSPQQLNGDFPTESDDIYALSVTIYALLTGTPPFFQGDLYQQIAHKTAPPMSERRAAAQITGKAAIPKEWEKAIASCLAKLPAQRPASALEMAERLGLRAPSARSHPVPPRGLVPVEPVKKVVPDPVVPRPSQEHRGPRRKKVVLALALLAGALLVLGLYLVGMRDRNDEAAHQSLGQPLSPPPEESSPRLPVLPRSSSELWTAGSGREIAKLDHHNAAWTAQEKAVGETGVNYVHDVAFSPNGRRIVTASKDKTARVWEAESGNLLATLTGHTEAVGSAQYSPDGRRIVTASEDKTARVWEAESGKLLATLAGHTDELWNVQYSPDGRRIVTASKDKTARVWEAESGNLLATLTGHTMSVLSAQFSPDGRRIVTASFDHTARVWEAESGKLLATLAGHTDELWNVQYSPDGRRIVTASKDKTARVWEAESGNLLATLTGHTDELWNVQYSPDGRHIVTASSDTIAQVWEVESGKLLTTLTGHTMSVFSAQFSPDGRRIVTASFDHTARVWEAESGKLLTTLTGHTGYVCRAQFSPDGRRIFTAAWDETARIWKQ